MEIKHAPDSDDVGAIVTNTINQLIDLNIMGLEFQISIHFIKQELKKMLPHAEDYMERNNIKRGIEYYDHFGKALGMAFRLYELN